MRGSRIGAGDGTAVTPLGLIALSLAGGSLPAIAQAQIAQVAQPSTTGETPPIGQVNQQADDTAASTGLADVIVTAQRRGQNLQSVPISVSAATASDLNALGVRSTADLATIAPSVTFATGPSAGSVTVRGVGGTGGGGDEPANAVYLDGVYLPSPATTVFQFNDIDRIEVLKGPQGTLFGRNASGGLVQVITRTPSFSPESFGEIGYGNYDTMHAAGYFSAGLTHNIAFNIAGLTDQQGEGWGKNLRNRQDDYRGGYSALHGKLLWNLDDATTVTGAVLFSRVRPAGSQGGSVLPGEVSTGGGTNVGFFNESVNTDDFSRSTDSNYALTVKHEFSALTLTSITSHDYVNSLLRVDQDGSPTSIVNLSVASRLKTWTQELQLSSPAASRLQWVAGAFYYHNEGIGTTATSGASVPAPLTFSALTTDQVTTSYAGYGQATYPVTDSTNLTAGIRYTQDHRTLVGFNSNNLGVGATIVPQTKTDRKVTWRLAIDQKLAPDILAYASYSRGFKSGLFNAAAPTLPPAEPQTADAYELGLKTELFDRHVRFNVAGFYNDINGLQVRGLFPGVPTAVFYNASGARVYGAETETNFLVSRHFSIQATAAYLHGRYKDGFTNALFFTPRTAPPFGLAQTTFNASGNVTVNTPSWVASIGGRYALPVSFGEIDLAGNYTYNSGYFFDPQDRVGNGAFHVVNASLEFHFGKLINVRLWANNIADQHYYSAINPSALGDLYNPAPPRTYGATIGWSFK